MKRFSIISIICTFSLIIVFSAIFFGAFVANESKAQIKPIKPIPPKYADALNLTFAEVWDILKIKAKTDLWNASIIADNSKNTLLGKISSKYDSDSVFNNYGDYGSKYGSNSIWNQYGDYGSKYSQHSAFNRNTFSPPYIVKNQTIIGRLTLNNSIPGAIDPYLLKALFPDEL